VVSVFVDASVTTAAAIAITIATTGAARNHQCGCRSTVTLS